MNKILIIRVLLLLAITVNSQQAKAAETVTGVRYSDGNTASVCTERASANGAKTYNNDQYQIATCLAQSHLPRS